MSTITPSLGYMSHEDEIRSERTTAAINKLHAYMYGDDSEVVCTWWARNREQPENRTLKAVLYGYSLLGAIAATCVTGSVASGALTGVVGPVVYESCMAIARTPSKKGITSYGSFVDLQKAAEKICEDATKSEAESTYASEEDRRKAWDDMNTELETAIKGIGGLRKQD